LRETKIENKVKNFTFYLGVSGLRSPFVCVGLKSLPLRKTLASVKVYNFCTQFARLLASKFKG